MAELNPQELRELLGAYALDAVDDDERAQVEALLLTDADARAELHRLEHAVAWLGHASPRPSPGVFDAVRDEVARDLAAASPVAAPEPDQDPAAPRATIAAPIDLHAARRRRTTWTRALAVAATVALVLGTIVALRVGDRGPDARTVALDSPSGQVLVTARLDPNGQGSIQRSRLALPPAGHVYQLWVQSSAGGPMESAGVLGRRPQGHRVDVGADARLLAVSVEPIGGSGAPTTDPVAISRELS